MGAWRMVGARLRGGVRAKKWPAREGVAGACVCATPPPPRSSSSSITNGGPRTPDLSSEWMVLRNTRVATNSNASRRASRLSSWPRWARSAPGAASRAAEGGRRMEGCAEVAPCIWLKHFGAGWAAWHTERECWRLTNARVWARAAREAACGEDGARWFCWSLGGWAGMGKGGLSRGAGGPNDGLSGRQGSVRVVWREYGRSARQGRGAQPGASEAGGGPRVRPFEGLSARSVWPAWAQGSDTRTHLAGRPRVGPGGAGQAGLW